MPTLTVHGNYNRKGLSKNSGNGLATVVRYAPTLLRRDGRSLRGSGRCDNSQGSQSLGHVIGELNGFPSGSLNPEWCEWYMGFPGGWTGLEPLETHRFRQWLLSHGEFCQDGK